MRNDERTNKRGIGQCKETMGGRGETWRGGGRCPKVRGFFSFLFVLLSLNSIYRFQSMKWSRWNKKEGGWIWKQAQKKPVGCNTGHTAPVTCNTTPVTGTGRDRGLGLNTTVYHQYHVEKPCYICIEYQRNITIYCSSPLKPSSNALLPFPFPIIALTMSCMCTISLWLQSPKHNDAHISAGVSRFWVKYSSWHPW